MKDELCPASRAEWRSWLREHHADRQEVWLIYYKKHTGEQTVNYRESVEEALCFGWIDGIRKTIDERRYCQRFTPRKARSKWSPLNIRLARKMIEQGRMTPAGLACFERRQNYGEQFLQARSATSPALPNEIQCQLEKHTAAWKNWSELAPGYQRQYSSWLADAKRPETRQRRLEKMIRLLEQNVKPGMKS